MIIWRRSLTSILQSISDQFHSSQSSILYVFKQLESVRACLNKSSPLAGRSCLSRIPQHLQFSLCVYMGFSFHPVLPRYFYLVLAWQDIPSGEDDLLHVNRRWDIPPCWDETEVNTQVIMISLLLGFCYGSCGPGCLRRETVCGRLITLLLPSRSMICHAPEKSFCLKIMHLLFHRRGNECWIFSKTDIVLQKGNQ